jgi:hypothetical protein
MLVWWFQRFDGSMRYRGETIPMYRLWHPRDHIRVRVLRPAPGSAARIAPGALIEICERLLEPVRVVARIVELDESGLRLQARAAGLTVVDHKHHFTPVPGGTRDHTRTVVGSDAPVVGRLLTRFARSRLFTDAVVQAYFRHGVEEVGNFQHFLPRLYAQRDREQLEL